MRKRKWIRLAILLPVMALGLVMTVYPLAASWYGERHRSGVRTEYQAALEAADTSSLAAARAAAEEWNRMLYAGEIDPLLPKENGYFDCLDLTGSGIMGYIRIPKINVELPIYHGTGDAALRAGAGHMPQTSLPVGGENTHAVISAHTGMASSPMFTDLELLEVGDRFAVEVLGEILTYQVTEIQVVLPVDASAVQIERGKDLCTLVTCTPYGVNTHRLLVRGKRVETPAAELEERTKAEAVSSDTTSVWMEQYWRSIGIGLAAAVGLILLAQVWPRRGRRKGRYEQE